MDNISEAYRELIDAVMFNDNKGTVQNKIDLLIIHLLDLRSKYGSLQR